jgi:hypothetical protein
MKSQKAKSNPKGEVILTGLDEEHIVVCEERMSVADYYEALHPILDEDCVYRLQMGIRYVTGKIYNYDGELDQEFTNDYDESGNYVRSKITFADGTVSEE